MRFLILRLVNRRRPNRHQHKSSRGLPPARHATLQSKPLGGDLVPGVDEFRGADFFPDPTANPLSVRKVAVGAVRNPCRRGVRGGCERRSSRTGALPWNLDVWEGAGTPLSGRRGYSRCQLEPLERSTSLTLRRKSLGVNGFWRNGTPSSRTPCRRMGSKPSW